jgi:hypothetical protein
MRSRNSGATNGRVSRAGRRQANSRAQAIGQLKRAFDQGRLALFLGAGVSVASQVPKWDQLVVSLYVNGIARRLGRYVRVPGLVASVGNWASKRKDVPLEVSARGLREYYSGDPEFVAMMRAMLYGLTGLQQWSRPRPTEIRKLLEEKNETLSAVAQLCRRSVRGSRGAQLVVTYNYDDLLEWILGPHPHEAIWKAVPTKRDRLPIYHVHGFIPLQDGRGSSLDEIVLSEDQYNRTAQNPYSWNNLVQMRALSEYVGLMVGLSLTDRNLRRILDNLRAMPSRTPSFALMKRPDPWPVENADLTSILDNMKERVAQGYEFGYDAQAIATLDDPAIHKPISRMIRDVQVLDSRRQEATLADLGVTVIWYDDHAEIAELLEAIGQPRSATRAPTKQRT